MYVGAMILSVIFMDGATDSIGRQAQKEYSKRMRYSKKTKVCKIAIPTGHWIM